MKRDAIWFVWIFLSGVIFFPGQCEAEFYKYVDENGKVRFTDNLANVPQAQRKEVEEYEEAPVVSPVPEQDTVTEQGSQETPQEGQPETGSAEGRVDETQAPQTGEEGAGIEGNDGAYSLGQQLKMEGEKLQEEYDALMKERTQLEETTSRRLTPAAQKILEKKIQDFNSRIKAYDERRKAHSQAVEDYKISGR